MPQRLAAGLFATVLLASSGSAQTVPAPTGPGAFVTGQAPGQWRASKLVGVDVYGSEAARIGDVREVLLNRNGTAETVVIGVGGFLGIGEKDVGVPFAALEWVTEPLTAAATRPVPPAPETASPPAPRGTTTGTAGSVAERDRAVVAVSRGYPGRAVLRMTRADLQNAPAFRYGSDTGAAVPAPATPPRQ